MRILLAAAALLYLGAAPVIAETHVFIIENHADYGVDRCLVSGARCGQVVASAYCQARNYSQAASFRKVDPDEVTGSTGQTTCRGALCGDWVAIECTR
jgi:hypothetical protein